MLLVCGGWWSNWEEITATRNGTARKEGGCYQSFKIKCGNVADWKIVLLTATFQSGNSAWSSAALLVAMLSLFSKVLQAP